jgi:hypothetical protein
VTRENGSEYGVVRFLLFCGLVKSARLKMLPKVYGLPVLVLTLGELHIEALQTFIEAANGLVLTDTAITLKTLHVLPDPAGPSSSSGFLSFAARKTTWVSAAAATDKASCVSGPSRDR